MPSSEADTVYVRGQSTGNGGVILHTDPECSHLNSSNNILEHPREVYPDDQPVCTYCLDEFDPAGGDASGPWETLEDMNPEDLATDGGSVQSDEDETGRPSKYATERFAYSLMTDTWYRVTEWDELADGQIQAKEKEEVDRSAVPEDVLDATTERDEI